MSFFPPTVTLPPQGYTSYLSRRFNRYMGSNTVQERSVLVWNDSMRYCLIRGTNRCDVQIVWEAIWLAVQESNGLCIGLSVLRTAMLLGFYAQQFPMCLKKGPPPKRHPANLTRLHCVPQLTWASIPVELFWHLVESMPWQIEAVLRAKGGVNSILGSYS
jgi:hypothetical protein